MNWTTKAKIQSVLARLPDRISRTLYYRLQRHFGALRHLNPLENLSAGIETCRRILVAGKSPIGGTFLEVGTGRRINTPLAFWLLGAKRVITVDINPYLKETLVREDLRYIAQHRRNIEKLFGSAIHVDRLDSLLRFASGSWRLRDLLGHCGIDYRAPAEAADLSLESASIDFHTSYTVLEHIPKPTVADILKEGLRLVKPDGLFVHRIDYSDHFSHSDRSISPINFLHYSDEDWSRIADNRYMYMNRLRVDDFVELYEEAGHRIRALESYVDSDVSGMLEREGFVVDKRFSSKPLEVLATTGSWVVTERF